MTTWSSLLPGFVVKGLFVNRQCTYGDKNMTRDRCCECSIAIENFGVLLKAVDAAHQRKSRFVLLKIMAVKHF